MVEVTAEGIVTLLRLLLEVVLFEADVLKELDCDALVEVVLFEFVVFVFEELPVLLVEVELKSEFVVFVFEELSEVFEV
jgi:hypothetical protein